MTPRRSYILVFAVLAALTVATTAAWGVQRNSLPEFSNGYTVPSPTTPPPLGWWRQYQDVLVLGALLCLSMLFALKIRSRAGVMVTMLTALAYMGFYRRGCICPVGSVQNVALALADPSYAIPLAALAFFLLPLAMTLFFGRTFCGGVCPLGAVQDALLVRPLKLPLWLESGLRLGAYAYLGLAVLYAVVGSGFVVCQYDPFVPIFRFDGRGYQFALAAVALGVAMFIGRPYCRFLCPYSVILRPLSAISQFHVTITPDKCVNCRLCEDVCPFNAIEKPVAPLPSRPGLAGKGAMIAMIAILPGLVALSGWAGWSLAPILADSHYQVRLAQALARDKTAPPEDWSNEKKAFIVTGQSEASVYRQAAAVEKNFAAGSALMGGFVGLAAGLSLVRLSVRRKNNNYEPDRSACVSCGRCFNYCPMGKLDKKRRENAKSTQRSLE